MTLLAPWALWFSAIGVAVVGLYLLRIKRKSVQVPALDFWLSMSGPTRTHSLFDRLRRLISMALWLLIAACLVVAIGNPVLSRGAVKPRPIAVVIDNSASMQAAEPGRDDRTRLRTALEAVERLTSSRPVTDEWLVIDAGRVPRVVQSWTHDPALARRAAESIIPFGGSGDLNAGVRLAAQLLAEKPDPCIVVLSDGDGGELKEIVSRDPRVIAWPIGTNQPNAGITKLAVRTNRQGGDYTVLASVFNSGGDPIESQLMLEIDGRATGVETVKIEPFGTWERTFAVDAPEGGVLRASLELQDALPLDNEAFAVLTPVSPAVIWLVGSGDSTYFFEQALSAMAPMVSIERSATMTPDQYESAAASITSPHASGNGPEVPELVIFINCSPRTIPASGRFIFAGAVPQFLPARVLGELSAPQLFVSHEPHPITENLSLQGARLSDGVRVSLTEQARVLARSQDADPMMFLIEQPGRLSLCLAFNALQSDLPFRNAFPMLLRNAVAFMHEEAPSVLRPRYAIGEPIRTIRPLAESDHGSTFTVKLNGQVATRPLLPGASAIIAEGLLSPGAVRLDVPGRPCFTAVSLVDRTESDTRVMEADDPAKALALSGRLFGAAPWFALAVCALVCVAIEWLTFHFRWTE